MKPYDLPGRDCRLVNKRRQDRPGSYRWWSPDHRSLSTPQLEHIQGIERGETEKVSNTLEHMPTPWLNNIRRLEQDPIETDDDDDD